MPNATVRASAQALPKASPHPDAELIALADKFEAAWNVERALKEVDGITDEELDVANARTEEIVNKIVARRASNTLMLKLKARAYLWAESWDLEELAPARDMVSDPILVSLFRDLGVADLDATPGRATMADSAPAQHEEACSTAAPSESQMSEVEKEVIFEQEVRNLHNFAAIAATWAMYLTPETEQERTDERERFIFVIDHVEEMAAKLDAAWTEASR